jgi:hypothetical protein
LRSVETKIPSLLNIAHISAAFAVAGTNSSFLTEPPDHSGVILPALSTENSPSFVPASMVQPLSCAEPSVPGIWLLAASAVRLPGVVQEKSINMHPIRLSMTAKLLGNPEKSIVSFVSYRRKKRNIPYTGLFSKHGQSWMLLTL